MKENRQITSWGHVDWIPSQQLGNIGEIGIVNLLPGRRQTEHSHYSENQFLYTLSGRGEHIINGQHFPIAPGDYFFLPCGATHTTTNLGDEVLTELMLSVPVHLTADQTGIRPADDETDAPDPDFVRGALLAGIRQLASETLDHLNIPVVITDAAQNPVYGGTPSGECQGCTQQKCPIRQGFHELSMQSGDACSSVVCPRGLTVLVQPVIVNGMIYYYIKGGLIRVFPNIGGSDESVYDVPGSTINSIRIFLQDMNHYLLNFYRDRRIERELSLRDAAVAEQRLHSEALSEAFEQSKYNTLNVQIRNHFLFNSLNSIASLAIEDNSKNTYKAILDLSELLRGLLRRDGSRVPLSEEFEFLQRYIRLQELRHEGRLTVNWRRCSAAETVFVPFNFLQPLVENSFLHAFKDKKGGMELTIESFVEGGRSVVLIRDNGCGMDEETLQKLRQSLRSGAVHGMPMIWRKLSGVFGMDFTLDIDSKPGCGTGYRLGFPL